MLPFIFLSVIKDYFLFLCYNFKRLFDLLGEKKETKVYDCIP